MSNPGGISTAPVLWLKADAGVFLGAALSTGVGVYQWNDQSPQGNDAYQSTGSYQPATGVNTLNGLPLVTFSGSPQRMTISDAFYPGANWTFFCVAKKAASGDRFIVLGNYEQGDPTATIFYSDDNAYGTNQNGYIDYADPATTWNYWTVKNAANTLTQYRAGIVKQTGTPTFNSTPYPWDVIGARESDTTWSNGDVAEIMVFPTALSDPDREAVEVYLNTKWFVAPAPNIAEIGRAHV